MFHDALVPFAERRIITMKKALIVGLNNYPDNELECCNSDAIAMKELLESNGDGSPNFEVVEITDRCTKKELKEHIEKLFADDADIALLYFSGHGADSDGGYLCTTDCSENDYGVRMTDVLEMANKSQCKNKVIILDCCFAAKMGESILLNNVCSNRPANNCGMSMDEIHFAVSIGKPVVAIKITESTSSKITELNIPVIAKRRDSLENWIHWNV